MVNTDYRLWPPHGPVPPGPPRPRPVPRNTLGQGKLIPISFREWLFSGAIEYTLSWLIDHELGLSIFDQRYDNDDTDDTGRPAYAPP